MAIGAQYHQVCWKVIASIVINMMDPKYFVHRIISAICTFFYPSPTFECLSSKSESTFTMSKLPILAASHRTENSHFAGRCAKYFFALFACPFFCAAVGFGSRITFMRAIFCDFQSHFRNAKSTTANLASNIKRCSLVFVRIQALPRTVFRNTALIWLNPINSTTIFTGAL
jgi:hypothetical protein